MGAQAGLSSKLCLPLLQAVLKSAIDFSFFFFCLFLPVFLELAKSALSKPLVCFSNSAERKNLTLQWVMGAVADPFLHVSLPVVAKTFSHLKVLFSFKVLGLIVS